MRGVLHGFGRRAENLPIIGGRIFASGAGGSENFAGELIVRRVLLDFFANPIAEQLRAFAAQELAVALQEIGLLIGPEIDILRAAN